MNRETYVRTFQSQWGEDSDKLSNVKCQVRGCDTSVTVKGRIFGDWIITTGG